MKAIYSPSYAAPADALADFLQFAAHARMRLEANPEWRDWLLSPDILTPSVNRGPGKWAQDLRDLAGTPNPGPDQAYRALRRLRQREYLLLGLLDFSGAVDVERTMLHLSKLADFCLQTVLDIATGQMRERHPGAPENFTILGMGKLGGEELNYSSDIDVIFIYGEDGELTPRLTYQEYFTRLAQRIVSAFSSQTGDGSLFRIDLRLRPEGHSGPLVRSLAGCENYYAAFGETWERMALIKARTSAGDEAVGYEFERMRAPFCYLRTVSPEVLDEIAAVKARIERDLVGEGNLDLHVKLGTGGIREIEFIAQAMQLLHGAKLPYLQTRGTLKALEAIETLDLRPAEETGALRDAYLFWRCVEHRLQMEHDLQTHSLPRERGSRDVIARSLGLEPGEFEELIAHHREAVRSIFDAIFESSSTPRSAAPVYATDFFRDPSAAAHNIEALIPGSGDTHAAPRTRQSFQRLWPVLERQLRARVDPDLVLTRFVSFVGVYGARGLLYESLATNPKAVELLLLIFDYSRFFSELLLARPELFEEAARGGTLDRTKTMPEFLAELREIKSSHALASRLYRRAELVRIFIRDILSLATLIEIESEYSALAEACLHFALLMLPPKEPLAFIGFGKFGGAELGYGSDLDCVIVGDDIGTAVEINRFMSEIMPTGILFPLDFRLRPNATGPIAMPLESYLDYYENKAQFWEIQALTRARFIAGDEDLGREFMEKTEAIWRAKCEAKEKENGIIREIAAMRYRVETQRGDQQHPDLEFKTGPGGLIDVEFGVQAHLMRTGRREPSTLAGLDLLAEAEPEIARSWREGYLFLRRVESVLRRQSNDSVSALPVDPRAFEEAARRIGFPNADASRTFHNEHRVRIRSGYERLMKI